MECCACIQGGAAMTKEQDKPMTFTCTRQHSCVNCGANMTAGQVGYFSPGEGNFYEIACTDACIREYRERRLRHIRQAMAENVLPG